MTQLANTPKPPYYAVVFTSVRTDGDNGYGLVAERMVELASQQAGFLGAESSRESEGVGITVSYWQDLESIKTWKQHSEHLQAQEKGKSKWYEEYSVRITKVERDYFFDNGEL